MNQQELLQLRLHYQQISASTFNDATTLVAWMGAVQAQDYAMAQWAVGLRLPGATEASIEKAIAEGALLRTHVMRPTWHYVAPADIRWLLRLTAPRVHTISGHYYRKLELDEAVFKKGIKVLEKTLRDHNYCDRQEIAEALGKARINTDDLRLTHILFYAELEGVICSGARKGKSITYALLEERVPPAASLNKEESLAELATRYFQSHGPATLKDFSWWSGLSITEARKAMELIREKLTLSQSKTQELAFIDNGQIVKKTNEIFLLPNYDEYTVAYADRGSMMSSEPNALSREGNPLFSNTLIINGKVEGSWKRVLKAKTAEVQPTPFTPLSAARQKQLQQAIARYHRFLEKEPIIANQKQKAG